MKQRLLKHRLLLFWFWAGYFVDPTIGQTPSNPDELSRQFVFFVDTSFSMARQKPTVTQTISDLILNGLNGQMQSGDTFVIWTFNEEVETRRFAPHIWAAEQRQALAQRAGQFLRSLRYEKQTRMDKAMAEMRNAIQASKALTVILVTDGDTPIAGTPYDRRINLLYSERGRDLRKIRKPFLTTLVTSNGQFLASVVSAAGEPIKIPETRPPVHTVPTIDLPSATRPEPPSVRPAAPQAEAIISASPPPFTPPQQTPAVQTNLSTVDPIPPASAQAIPVPDGSESVKPTPPSAVPRPAETSTPEAEPVKSRIETAPPVMESALSKNDIPAVTTPAARTESGPTTKASADTDRPSPDLADIRPEKERPAPDRVPVSTPESSQLAVVDNAALAASSEASNPQRYLVLGLALLLLALGLVVWYLRNARPQSRPSLISRSLDNRKK
jgi:hypothetical protein